MSEQSVFTNAANLGVDRNPVEVILRDVDMTIWAMSKFMVKWAIASIPAAIILVLIFWIVLFLVNAVSKAMVH